MNIEIGENLAQAIAISIMSISFAIIIWAMTRN